MDVMVMDIEKQFQMVIVVIGEITITVDMAITSKLQPTVVKAFLIIQKLVTVKVLTDYCTAFFLTDMYGLQLCFQDGALVRMDVK